MYRHRSVLLIALISVVGAGVFAAYSLHSARKREATREWYACAHDKAERILEGALSTETENLIESIHTECRRQLEVVVSECGLDAECAATAQRTVVGKISWIRDELTWERDQARKRSQIDVAIKELGKVGVDREDIKDYFREEILRDKDAEKHAIDEANAASDSEREPGYRRR
ncbi:hypothetical protein IVB56_24940 [Bradyrhizobium sp. CW7]|uniref:hypothetical protein n=1 Tax=Bradyrhizobium sp. CW7 TaxID=2782688 RepID=UPI001FF7DB0E|nr:hypothetical protein [Bradyrhizobium sp. CW7]MCK1354216.1 hypothetical protein [Bradyrhizobium sp. CW7]